MALIEKIKNAIRDCDDPGEELAHLFAQAALTAIMEAGDGVQEAFYIDCEFDGHGGPLLSMAIVHEYGSGMHYTVNDAGPVTDPWVAANVLPILGQNKATESVTGPLNELGQRLRWFIADCERPTIIADSPVDIGRFCAALSTGSDGGWASADYLGMTFEVHNVDCYPTELVGAVQHNAWWDAMALRAKVPARHRSTAAAAERARIVAWLRGQPKLRRVAQDMMRQNAPADLADAIERGEV